MKSVFFKQLERIKKYSKIYLNIMLINNNIIQSCIYVVVVVIIIKRTELLGPFLNNFYQYQSQYSQYLMATYCHLFNQPNQGYCFTCHRSTSHYLQSKENKLNSVHFFEFLYQRSKDLKKKTDLCLFTHTIGQLGFIGNVQVSNDLL